MHSNGKCSNFIKINVENKVIVKKRNARERCRVRAVNEAFNKLRMLLPSLSLRQKRVSKLKTIKKAIQYISELNYVLK